MLAVGEALPPLAGAAARAALPIDVARTIEDLFERAALDLCHVHEPFAPWVATVALRHSRALNVGTFHAPTERVVATQVARKVVQLVFGRLDARPAAYGATADLLRALLPRRLRIVAPGADPTPRAAPRRRRPLRLAFVDQEERGALRLFLRALRRLDRPPVGGDGAQRARPVVLDPAARRPARARALRRRDDAARALLARRRRARRRLGRRRARARAVSRAHGRRRRAGRLAPGRLRGAAADGEAGLLFEPSDLETLAAQLARLVADRACARGCARAARPRPWTAVADELEALYGTLAARRHDTRGDPTRARLRRPAH